MKKTNKKKKKLELHPRNKHKGKYDFSKLIESNSELSKFVRPNKYNNDSIDFANPEAVKALNTAILYNQYKITDWGIPEGYLCPPIPGRADYIHYIADLLADGKETPTGKDIKCLDIGTGANCIYPIIGITEYDWSFVGTDIDEKALENAKKITDSNPKLKSNIEFRLQSNTVNIFKGIIKENEKFDVSICNPPFHKSLAEAQKGTLRKLRNLSKEEITKITLNFGGQSNELHCKGGEKQFIINMILESKEYANSCKWFTTLVSKQDNLENIYKTMERAGVTTAETFKMGQGNKVSRIVCWTFL